MMRERSPVWLVTLVAVLAIPPCFATRSETLELRLPDVEGAAHGFPIMRGTNGRKLADCDFAQWIENDRLRIKLTYDFGDGHRIEENTRFRQNPALIQEE